MMMMMSPKYMAERQQHQDLAYVRALIERKVRRVIVGEADVQYATEYVFVRILKWLFWIREAPVNLPRVDLCPVAEKELGEWLRDALLIRTMMYDNAPPQSVMFHRRLRAVLGRVQGVFEI
jgi:hypothetical protein